VNSGDEILKCGKPRRPLLHRSNLLHAIMVCNQLGDGGQETQRAVLRFRRINRRLQNLDDAATIIQIVLRQRDRQQHKIGRIGRFACCGHRCPRQHDLGTVRLRHRVHQFRMRLRLNQPMNGLFSRQVGVDRGR
jgi:hypothetical protein